MQIYSTPLDYKTQIHRILTDFVKRFSRETSSPTYRLFNPPTIVNKNEKIELLTRNARNSRSCTVFNCSRKLWPFFNREQKINAIASRVAVALCPLAQLEESSFR